MGYNINSIDNCIEMLKYIQLDLLKESIESLGYDMKSNKNDVEYTNYLIENPIYINDFGFNLPYSPSDLSRADVNASWIDSYIDYNSDNPFARLPGPPAGSKIALYWANGSVKSKGRVLLTFSQYMQYAAMSTGTSLTRIPFTGPADNTGDSWSGKGNGRNNPVNISYGALAKKWGSTGSRKAADGQPCAVFDNMKHGLCASMEFLMNEYHGQNICQINNRHQGYVKNDAVPPPKGIGDPLGMAALRLKWVTHQCNKTGLRPFQQLDMRDKDTIFQLTNAVSKNENGFTFGYKYLDDAYKKIMGQ